MTKNTDKKTLFEHAWRVTFQGEPFPFVTEYHFAAETCGGTGKGIRARLADAGLKDWRFDFAYLDQRLAVEIEGNAWHVNGGGRHMQDTDLEKYNFATLDGWRVFRFSPGMLKRDPAGCVELVRKAMQ